MSDTPKGPHPIVMEFINGEIDEGGCIARLERELAAANETLQFVERWANHHGQKDCISPAEALSCIQHYPPILAITRGYADGKTPATRNPWAELEAARAQISEARSAGIDAERSRICQILRDRFGCMTEWVQDFEREVKGKP